MTTDRPKDREAPKAFQDDEQTLPSPVIRGATTGEALGPGRVLDGRYTLVERIGAGGWGEVWRALQNSTRREVALKILRRDVASGEGARERFQLEAEAVSRLVHQNTVTLFDYGHSAEGETYMAMELLDGETLDQILRREGPMEPARALGVIRQVALSLDEAHGKGIVHRDVKPHNIMLIQRPGESDFVKVLDFGVAKWVLEDHQLTTTGTTFGTPEYMSPEQVQSKPMDHRTDLYSLGVILYTLLAARPPFRGDSPITVALQHIQVKLPPLPRAVTPPRPVERFIRSLTAKEAARRPFSAAEVAETCDGIIRDMEYGVVASPRRTGPWLALAAGLLLGTAVITVWRPWEGPEDATSFPPSGSAQATVPPGGSLQSEAADVALEISTATDVSDALSTTPLGGDDAGASSGEVPDVAAAPEPEPEPDATPLAPDIVLAEDTTAPPPDISLASPVPHPLMGPGAPPLATITITGAAQGAVATLPGGGLCPCPCSLERPLGTRLKITVGAPDHEPRRMTLKFRGGAKEIPARLVPIPLSERDGLKGDDPPSTTDGLK